MTTAGLPLRLRGIAVEFADRDGAARRVLDIAEFDLAAGTHAAVCGASGSGKTTLLHVLAGIELPQQGSVQWGAVEVTALAPAAADRWRRETVGFVFQHFHLFPGVSALENVLLSYRFDRWSVPSAARERAAMLLDRVGVRKTADVGSLSRGEAQRVAVARALVREPAIILADEPTASLDATTARDVGDLLVELCTASGATLIVATHDTRLASTLATPLDLIDGDLLPRGTAQLRPRLVQQA
jgi:putative ABC transport system ATP-binding protein